MSRVSECAAWSLLKSVSATGLAVSLAGALLSCQDEKAARSAKISNASGTAWVYGCGVDKRIPITRGQSIPLHKVIQSVQPLPDQVNGIIVTISGTNFFCIVSNAVGNYGDGKLPVSVGDSITLVHGDR